MEPSTELGDHEPEWDTILISGLPDNVDEDGVTTMMQHLGVIEEVRFNPGAVTEIQYLRTVAARGAVRSHDQALVNGKEIRVWIKGTQWLPSKKIKVTKSQTKLKNALADGCFPVEAFPRWGVDDEPPPKPDRSVPVGRSEASGRSRRAKVMGMDSLAGPP